jgi:hypothetical protein
MGKKKEQIVNKPVKISGNLFDLRPSALPPGRSMVQ